MFSQLLRVSAGIVVALVVTWPLPSAARADEKVERWFGTLDMGVAKLRLFGEVTAGDKPGHFIGHLLSLDQGNAKLELDSFAIEGDRLTFQVKKVRAEFEGTLNEKRDIATGTFTQFGKKIPLKLRRVDKVPTETVVAAWIGTIDVGGKKLKLQFRELESDGGARVFAFDSLSQKVTGLSATMRIEGKSMRCEVPSIGGKYEGTLNEAGTVSIGKWKQSGKAFDLKLDKQAAAETSKEAKMERPQHPQTFAYEVEGVRVRNEADDFALAGTLTVPKSGGPFPAVVLVSGSGPQDRDESIAGHKPFLVISDHLTNNGIAVLRYDDRGVGESEGEFASATTVDFARDAKAAVKFLQADPRVDAQRVGVVGHSEGGLIATILAASMDDLSHVILLAGPGVPGDQILRSQTQAIGRASGNAAPDTRLLDAVIGAVKQGADPAGIAEVVDAYDRAQANSDETAPGESSIETPPIVRQAYSQMATPWFYYFVSYDPRDDLQRVRCSVLALIGSKDLQVLADLNLPEIETSLRRSSRADFRCLKLEGLNDLFQTAETGSPVEYGELTETFSPHALTMIADWVHEH